MNGWDRLKVWTWLAYCCTAPLPGSQPCWSSNDNICAVQPWTPSGGAGIWLLLTGTRAAVKGWLHLGVSVSCSGTVNVDVTGGARFLTLFCWLPFWPAAFTLTLLVDKLRVQRKVINANETWEKQKAKKMSLNHSFYSRTERGTIVVFIMSVTWRENKNLPHTFPSWIFVLSPGCARNKNKDGAQLSGCERSSVSISGKNRGPASFFRSCLSWVHTAMIFICLKCLFRSTNICVSYIHITPPPSTGI